MDNLLLDFIQYLMVQGIVTGDGIDAFRDKAPASPDDCLYLVEYRGQPEQFGNFGTRWIQFNYRSASYNTARQKCYDVFKLFGIREEDAKTQLTVDRWAIVHCQTSPFKSSVDSQGRITFTFNARVLTYFD